MKLEEGLASKLYSLSKIVLEESSKTKISTISRLYLKQKIDDINKSRSQQYIMREELNIREVFTFRSSIKKISEYSEIVSLISKEYGINKDPADDMLLNFFSNLLFERSSGIGMNYRTTVTDSLLLEYVTEFIGSLNQVPPTQCITLWIEGLMLEEQEYQISENMLIRKVRTSDLEVEIPIDDVLFSMQFGIYNVPDDSSAILELRYKGLTEGAKKEVNTILTSLMLYRLGSIFSQREDRELISYRPSKSTGFSGKIYTPYYKYTLKKEDIPYLNVLIGIIRDQLPLTLDGSNPIHIAFERYNQALLKPESIENRITFVINCLEALYLKREERAELSHRLGQRVSAILRHLDFIPIEVYRDIIKAYDIRSNYIHGQIEPEKHGDATKLEKKVFEYARISLLVFIQLMPRYSKEEIINRADNSLLDAAVCYKLERIIISNCKIFK